MFLWNIRKTAMRWSLHIDRYSGAKDFLRFQATFRLFIFQILLFTKRSIWYDWSLAGLEQGKESRSYPLWLTTSTGFVRGATPRKRPKLSTESRPTGRATAPSSPNSTRRGYPPRRGAHEEASRPRGGCAKPRSRRRHRPTRPRRR